MSAEPILVPDETASELGVVAFVSCDAFPEATDAIRVALREDYLGRSEAGVRAVPILMRLVSEVEAKINGNETPFWVECTKRAKAPVAYWKVTSDA